MHPREAPADGVRDAAQHAWYAGTWRWLLLLLFLPLWVLVLNHVLLPLLARTLLKGRLRIRFASLLNGIHEIAWLTADGAEHIVRCKRVYVALRLPGLVHLRTDGQPVRGTSWFTVCVESMHVRIPPKRADRAHARAAAEAAAADQLAAQRRDVQHQEEHLQELMAERRGSATPEPSALPAAALPAAAARTPATDAAAKSAASTRASAPASPPGAALFAAFAPLAHLSASLAPALAPVAGVLASLGVELGRFALTMLTSLVDIEIRDVEMSVPEVSFAVAMEHVALRASAVLAYQWRGDTAGLPASADRFGEHVAQGVQTPAADSRAMRKVLGIPVPFPTGHARVQLDVRGLRALGFSKRYGVSRRPATILLAKDLSRFEVSAAVGRGRTRESVWLGVQLAETRVNAGAALRLLARVKRWLALQEAPAAPDSPAPAAVDERALGERALAQRHSAGADVLRCIAGAAFSLPALRVQYTLPDATEPPGAQLCASVREVHFRLDSSAGVHGVHQDWLGTCGIVGYRSSGRHRVPLLRETRRIFHARAACAGAEVRYHPSRDAGAAPNSLLLRVVDTTFWARSSYTPFGIFDSAEQAASNRPRMHLTQDPNEHAAAVSLSFGAVHGAAHLQHLCALVRQLDRVQASRPPRAAPPPRPRAPIVQFPRLGVVVNAGPLAYMVHVNAHSLRSAEPEAPDTVLVAGLSRAYLSAKSMYAKSSMLPMGTQEPLPSRVAGASERPLQYESDVQLHSEDLDVYLCDAPPGDMISHVKDQVAHFDMLRVPLAEATVHARVPVGLEPATLFPLLYAHQARLQTNAHVAQVEVDVWEPRVLESLALVADRLREARAAQKHDREVRGSVAAAAPPPPRRPLLDRLPSIENVHVCVNDITAFLGSHDPNYEPEVSRGMVLKLASVTLDYAHTEPGLLTEVVPPGTDQARAELGLPPLASSRAQALAAGDNGGATAALVLEQVVLYPVVDIASVHEQGGAAGEEGGAAGEEGGAAGEEGGAAGEEGSAAGAEGGAGGEEGGADTPTTPPSPEEKANATISGEPGTPGAQAHSPEWIRASGSAKDTRHEAPSLYAPGVWNFDYSLVKLRRTPRREKKLHQLDPESFMVRIPVVRASAEVRTPGAQPEILVQCDVEGAMALKVQLLHTYCLLVAFSAVRQMLVPKDERQGEGKAAEQGEGKAAEQDEGKPAGKPETRPAEAERTPSPTSKPTETPESAPERPESAPETPGSSPEAPPPSEAPLSIEIKAHIPETQLFAFLPNKEPVFVVLYGLHAHVHNMQTVRASFEYLRAVVKSAQKQYEGAWEEGVKLRHVVVLHRKSGVAIQVNGDCGHVRIPFGYHTHALIRGTIMGVKATKQLVHQFVFGREGSTILPRGKAPVRLPTMSIRLRILVVEAADDPFESRLRLALMVGRDEQLSRMERAQAFSARAAQLHSDLAASPSVPGEQRPPSSASVGSGTRPGEQATELARERLERANSATWIARIRAAQRNEQRREERLLSYIHKRYAGAAARGATAQDTFPVDVVPSPCAPPLARMLMMQLCVDVSPPKGFSLDRVHEYLHEQAGNPVEMQYTTLVPLHLRWRMSECVVRQRDYPLALFSLPPLAPDQDVEQASFDAEGDLCVAEQLGDEYTVSYAPATVVPAVAGEEGTVEHGILVPRTALPPKLYGPLTVHVNTRNVTHFAWGQSMQPCIQDLVRVFDSISSPPQDPSPKPGPWDKLPFVLQSRLHILFACDVRLHLKGSRDPYELLDKGAGWVMSWQRDVELRLGFANPDRETLQVISGEHVLAIPDLSHLVDPAALGLTDVSPSRRDKAAGVLANVHAAAPAPLTKVCWRLSNGVRLGIGLISEHTCTDGTCTREPRCSGKPFFRKCRMFGRKPHWDVMLRSREGFSKLPPEQQTDSYHGWRSDFVHFSLSVQSVEPVEEAPLAPRSATSNCLYVTPLSWAHFLEWKALFNSRLSLPVRQGSIFPQVSGAKSPKFGKHVGTIKYRFDITPLFLTHTYHQHLKYDLYQGVRTFVGVKARLATFYLDMHQRLQETLHERKQLGTFIKAFRKPLYEAELDASSAKLYCLAARFREPYGPPAGSSTDPDDGRYDLFGEVFSEKSDSPDARTLYDAYDFVELDAVPLREEPVAFRMHEALACQHLTFHRRVESELLNSTRPGAAHEPGPNVPGVHASELGQSKFGHEDTHTCLIGRARDMVSTHLHFHHTRLRDLDSDVQALESMANTYATNENQQNRAHASRLDLLRRQQAALRRHLFAVQERRRHSEAGHTPGSAPPMQAADVVFPHTDDPKSAPTAFSDPSVQQRLADEQGSFDDQIYIYSPTGIISSETRNLLLRYYTSWRLRLRLVHQLNASAQRNIMLLDRPTAAAAQGEDRAAGAADGADGRRQSSDTMHMDTEDAEAMLQEFFRETLRIVGEGLEIPELALEDYGAEFGATNPCDAISDAYTLNSKNICVCVRPQLILHSDEGPNSTLLIVANKVRLRNYAVCDDQYVDDSVNRNVMRRNYITLHGLQCFHRLGLQPEERLADLALGPEELLDLHLASSKLTRIIPETHAYVHYDRHNKMRMPDKRRPLLAADRWSDPNVEHLRHHMDFARILCPRFTVSVTTEQYAAIYHVVMHLLLYRDPVAKEHAKQLDSMLYSHNFEDPALVLHAVSMLQAQIHQITSVRNTYLRSYDRLNPQGRREYVRQAAMLIDLYSELLLIGESVNLSRASSLDKQKQFALRILSFARQIEWNMIGEAQDNLLVRLSLQNVAFSRVELANSMSANTVALADAHAINAHPTAYFQEILSKYTPSHHDNLMFQRQLFFSTAWLQLPPAGGIPIVDSFCFHLHPVRVQIEYRVGRQVFEYLFGTQRSEEKQRRRIEQAPPESKRERWMRRLHIGSARRAAHDDVHAATREEPELSSDEESPDESLEADLSSSEEEDEAEEKFEGETLALRPQDIKSMPFARVGIIESQDEAMSKEFALVIAEMAQRASRYSAFINVALDSVTMCLSYKADSARSIADVFDLVFEMPKLQYNNILGSYGDLADAIKKDVIKVAWRNKSTLLKGMLSGNAKKRALFTKLRDERLKEFGEASVDPQQQLELIAIDSPTLVDDFVHGNWSAHIADHAAQHETLAEPGAESGPSTPTGSRPGAAHAAAEEIDPLDPGTSQQDPDQEASPKPQKHHHRGLRRLVPERLLHKRSHREK